MIRFNALSLKALGLSVMLGGAQSCSQPESVPAADVAHFACDTTVLLKENVDYSPSCKIKFDLNFLTSDAPSDSVTKKINAILFQQIDDGASADLQPEAFVASLLDNLIGRYRADVQPFFEEDLKRGVIPDNVPQWYNYDFQIVSSLEKGKDGVWNCIVEHFSYTGGAHPNTVQCQLNITPDGQLLTQADVFLPHTERAICELLQQGLIREANERLDTDTISGLQGLQEHGILQMNSIFVPDNFLLKENGISFHFNHYDVAPYAMGSFDIEIPYQELDPYLIKTTKK